MTNFTEETFAKKLASIQILAEANGASDAYKKVMNHILEKKEETFDGDQRDMLLTLAHEISTMALNEATAVRLADEATN